MKDAERKEMFRILYVKDFLFLLTDDHCETIIH